MIYNNTQDIIYYTFSSLEHKEFKHAVLSRLGGVSNHPYSSLNISTSTGDSHFAVQTNIDKIISAFALTNTKINTLNQVHGTNVVAADSTTTHISTQADAIITDTPHTTLLLSFADCVPIILFDNKTKAIALIHSGWRGTLNGIIQSTISKMTKAYKCNPANILAAIGPCISTKHYEVSYDIAKQFMAIYPPDSKVVNETSNKYYISLVDANIHNLTNSGVIKIELSNMCTVRDNQYFYSHRLENNQTGRFGVLISL